MSSLLFEAANRRQISDGEKGRKMGKTAQANRAIVGEFLTHNAEVKGHTEGTGYAYARGFMVFLDMMGERPLSSATENDVVRYITAPMMFGRGGRAAGEQVSAATKYRRRSEMSTLFKWMHARNKIAVNPCALIDMSPSDDGEVDPIDDDLWIELWDQDLIPEDRVAFGTGMFCGLRRQESVRLGPHNVRQGDLKDFWRKGDRRGHKYSGNMSWLTCARLFAEHRPDLLPDINVFVGAVAATIDKGHPLLVSGWNDHLRRRNAQTSYAYIRPGRYNDRFGMALDNIGHTDEAHPHQLRHAFCTVMVNDCGLLITQVRDLANHKSTTTTERYVRTPPIGEDKLGGGGDDILARFGTFGRQDGLTMAGRPGW